MVFRVPQKAVNILRGLTTISFSRILFHGASWFVGLQRHIRFKTS
jgi:hypothetical protein